MPNSSTTDGWTIERTAALLAVPDDASDKYSRGVLGIATGSVAYPGAAVLGVEAAVRTGVGMVRYLGPANVTSFVLLRRPEVVAAPGRVQAWVTGSGIASGDARVHDDELRIRAALADGVPVVVDAGALDLVGPGTARGLVVVTPHARELERLLATTASPLTVEAILADAAAAARTAADTTGFTVLLKGSTTHVAAPGASHLEVTFGTPWLATAGSGDVLAGILGALLATHAPGLAARGHELLAELAAAAAALHGLAARRASLGGVAPIAALDVAEAVPAVVAELLAPQR